MTSASKLNIEPNGGIFDVSPRNDRASPDVKTSKGVFTLGEMRSLFVLTLKIPPLHSMLNFDADVKKTTARHPVGKPPTLHGPKRQRTAR